MEKLSNIVNGIHQEFNKGDIVTVKLDEDPYTAVVAGSHYELYGAKNSASLYEIFEIEPDGKLIMDPITMPSSWMERVPDSDYDGMKLANKCIKKCKR